MPDLGAQYAAGMATLAGLRRGQMVDTCTVTRPTDEGQTPVLDPDGNIVAAGSPVYDGPCTLARFKSSGIRVTSPLTLNDEDAVPEMRTLRVPLDADLRSGDVMQMTACTFSPGLVGMPFIVLHEDPRTFATFRSFTVRGALWQPPPG